MDRLRGGLFAVVMTPAARLLARAGTPSASHVAASSPGMFFEIPHDWHTYSQSPLKRDGLAGRPLSRWTPAPHEEHPQR
jgi:hypothetical protein